MEEEEEDKKEEEKGGQKKKTKKIKNKIKWKKKEVEEEEEEEKKKKKKKKKIDFRPKCIPDPISEYYFLFFYFISCYCHCCCYCQCIWFMSGVLCGRLLLRYQGFLFEVMICDMSSAYVMFYECGGVGGKSLREGRR